MKLHGLIKKATLAASLSVLPTLASAEGKGGSLKLIELFTSHGCSSCPPADRLLGDLLNAHEDLMALEYHVDYWNSLVHGSDGSFTDPYSKSDYSMRQREYNHANLAGRPGVYTPQAVVNGRTASVGSNKRQIVKALSVTSDQALTIAIENDDKAADDLKVSISGTAEQREKLQGLEVRLVSYLDQATTQITGGENRDLTLVNHHVVLEVSSLGRVSGSGNLHFRIPRPAADQGCVVLVQEGARTPVYAAAECP
ncbi:MAG: DUF1223 domain-containing protein [Granulosicoccus sp.]